MGGLYKVFVCLVYSAFGTGVEVGVRDVRVSCLDSLDCDGRLGVWWRSAAVSIRVWWCHDARLTVSEKHLEEVETSFQKTRDYQSHFSDLTTLL